MNPRHGSGLPSRQRGLAFLLVLWVVAMLTILLGSFALIARTENIQARHMFDTTQARYAAEAGLNLAVYEMRKADPMLRWVGDGRPYVFGFGDAEVEVRITDDSGKINLNGADPKVLTNLFTARGVPPDRAEALAAAVKDWIDGDDETSLNGAEDPDYKAAGLSYGPANAQFSTVSELQQVLGMNYELFTRVEPALTIFTGQSMPNAQYAPLEALEAMPDMTPECARQIIEQRQAMQPGQTAGPAEPICGVSIGGVTGGGGVTYSVQSRARLPNGTSTNLDATIRMGGVNPAGRPFVILRWRDGENS
ncbi:general secretion pathway protein GspK [Dokdonella sp.]|uniref:general secretion pathway protein GspK n=1 Tax=Dokdonella sp. TaxID=2291710 RepID=UPI0025C1109E|nr:general secretion pathway protein GspK [Dokdonella sp.]MBX3689860.1 general secretion pathway protein GspK [Dokdonella sp.]